MRWILTIAARLALLAHLAATPDEPGIRPEVKRVNGNLREEYRQITADLTRYDRMRAFGSASEFGAAALGQLGGGIVSPESWLGAGAKGASWLARVGNSALRQGAISGAADLGVQGLNINAGVLDRWDPRRTGGAFGFGAALGGGRRLATEGLNHVGSASPNAWSAVVLGPTGQFYSVAFETKLSPRSYPGVSRPAHFQEANESLLRTMEGQADFAGIMGDLRIGMERTSTGLAPRTPPAGWTWHHAEEPGVMQLVPRSQHAWESIFQDALHPNGRGGYSIWGKQ
jgi:A nuclease of the HNH/ENDO VII superfamily with conserved WHH